MITKKERVLASLRRLPADQVREIIKSWAVSAVHAQKTFREAIIADGFERVDVRDGAAFVGDGDDMRSVIWVRGEAYALPVDEHKRRRDEALKQAKGAAEAAADAAPKTKPGEALTSVLCPSCQSIMAKSPVCPRCAKGKAGFKILCICTECGHEVYL